LWDAAFVGHSICGAQQILPDWMGLLHESVSKLLSILITYYL
jgi:hypothetical protein